MKSGEMDKVSVYHDFNQFNKLRSMARNDQAEALPKVARQFESLFLNMLMKNMRATTEVFSSGNMLHSPAEKQYQSMYDQELTNQLSQKGGIGLADMLIQQLTPKPQQQNKDIQDYKVVTDTVKPEGVES